jgi:hypothetical protein
MAVDGIPWKERFDEVHGYSTYGNGSVIAEVSANGRKFIAKDGREDARLPRPSVIRINKNTSKWRNKYLRILGLSISDAGEVAAKVLSTKGVTIVVDDVLWSNWYHSSRDSAFARCHSSIILRVQRTDFSTLVVNDKKWDNVFDELGSIGCEASGIVSVAVKRNGLWGIARNGKVLTQWFAEVRCWAIDQEGRALDQILKAREIAIGSDLLAMRR